MQTIIVTLNNGKKTEYVKGIKIKEVLNFYCCLILILHLMIRLNTLDI